jgi:hypothetical protein
VVSPLTKYLSGGTSGVKSNTTCHNAKGVQLKRGFHREVDENLARPVYYAASSGNSLPTFRDNLSHFQLTLQDGTDRLPGNVGKELQLPAK